MQPVTGAHKLGPDSASLQVKTYREGMAAKAGHDLVIDVTRWAATVRYPRRSRELDDRAERRLALAGGAGRPPGTQAAHRQGSQRDPQDIDEKVLHGQPITFRSNAMRLADGDPRLTVEGDLTMAGTTRPVTARLNVAADGRVSGTIFLVQSTWGIKPYRGLMAALKVRDELEIVIDAVLPAREPR